MKYYFQCMKYEVVFCARHASLSHLSSHSLLIF